MESHSECLAAKDKIFAQKDSFLDKGSSVGER